jgi:hypothetical protein
MLQRTAGNKFMPLNLILYKFLRLYKAYKCGNLFDQSIAETCINQYIFIRKCSLIHQIQK